MKNVAAPMVREPHRANEVDKQEGLQRDVSVRYFSFRANGLGGIV